MQQDRAAPHAFGRTELFFVLNFTGVKINDADDFGDVLLMRELLMRIIRQCVRLL